MSDAEEEVEETTCLISEEEKEEIDPIERLAESEFTIFGVILIILIGVILSAANTYLALFSGFPISVSIPSAILSMIFGKNNILENNIVQTGASAGSVVSGGIIVVIPAFFIMKYWKSMSFLNYLAISSIACIGGLLGVFFSIPLRRALIIERELDFPEGRATSEVLKAGEKGSGYSFLYIVFGALIGFFYKFCETGLKLWSYEIEIGSYIGPVIFYFSMLTSPALFGIGYIINLRISFIVFLGGAFGFWFGVPVFSVVNQTKIRESDAIKATIYIFENYIRYVGVGTMTIGALYAIFEIRSSLFQGLRIGLKSSLNIRQWFSRKNRTEKDIPTLFIIVGVSLLIIPLFLLFFTLSSYSFLYAILATIIVITIGFMFSSAAAYMAGVVGSSNNPISGISLATVLTSSILLLLIFGKEFSFGAAGALFICSVITVASALSSDNMQDLKSGFLVGSTPYKQQISQILGIIIPSFVIGPIIMLLNTAYGIGAPSSENPNPLPAPQARLMFEVAKGVFESKLPWNFIIIGVVFACFLILVSFVFQFLELNIEIPILAMATGLYLPFSLSTPILVGGFLGYLSSKIRDFLIKDENKKKLVEQRALLFIAGLISGESLMGVLIAIPIGITQNKDIFAVFGSVQTIWLSIPILGFILMLFFVVSIGATEILSCRKSNDSNHLPSD
eukprot:gene4730-8313_t